MTARSSTCIGVLLLAVPFRLEAQEGGLERVAPGVVSTDRNETPRR